jgi:hypothetical protein
MRIKDTSRRRAVALKKRIEEHQMRAFRVERDQLLAEYATDLLRHREIMDKFFEQQEQKANAPWWKFWLFW